VKAPHEFLLICDLDTGEGGMFCGGRSPRRRRRRG
jgi:hypothetical protein